MKSSELLPFPETLLDTQSILLDGGVNDAHLAEVLIRIHGDELAWLAMVMLLNGQPALAQPSVEAWQIVRNALARVVAHRDRIWEHPSLRAWLAHQVLQGCRLRQQQECTRLRFQIHRTVREWIRKLRPRLGGLKDKTQRAAPISPLQAAWNKMGRREQQTMLLFVAFGLSRAEIASAVVANLYLVEFWIKESRRKISTALKKNPIPGLELSRDAEERSVALAHALQRLWPMPGPRVEEQPRSTEQIETQRQAMQERRRSAIAAREAVLISLVLGGLFFTCRAAHLLPQEIIHRSRAPTPATPFYYNYTIQEGDTLESIAQKAGVPPQDIRNLNRDNLFEDASGLKPGISIKLPASPAIDWRVKPTPVIPPKPPAALTVHSDPSAIWARLQASSRTWQTLWMTFRSIEYGPPGYLGPPLNIYEEQVWISQPDRYKIIGRSASEGDVSYVLFSYNGVAIGQLPGTNDLYGTFSAREPDPFLSIFLSGGNISRENNLQPLREEHWAGRQALVVRVSQPGSQGSTLIWMDAITGVILRRLDTSADAPDIVTWERQVAAIAYNHDFPAGTFAPANPFPANLARDFTGQPLPQGMDFPWPPAWPEDGHAQLPVIPVAPGFDPSRQPVFIQWPVSWTVSDAKTSEVTPNPQGNPAPEPVDTGILLPGPRIEVFASRYYLGSLPLTDVTFNTCQRSPDGQIVALGVHNNNAAYTSGQLVWFRLDTPEDFHRLPSYWGGPISFSPDSRRLAYHRCLGALKCSIAIENLESGDVQTLVSEDNHVMSLFWSPDGQFLAILSALIHDATKVSLKVFDLQNGKVIYTGAYNPVSGSMPADSPTRAWRAALPAEGANRQGCMLPFRYPESP